MVLIAYQYYGKLLKDVYKRQDLFIVDINNGFAKGGALYSPRIESLINPIVNFTKSVSKDIRSIIAFTDYHTNESVEMCIRDRYISIFIL